MMNLNKCLLNSSERVFSQAIIESRFLGGIRKYGDRTKDGIEDNSVPYDHHSDPLELIKFLNAKLQEHDMNKLTLHYKLVFIPYL